MSKPALSTLVKKAAAKFYSESFTIRKRGEYIYITSRVGTPYEYSSSHKLSEHRDHDYRYAEALCDYHAVARSYYDN